MESGFEPHLSRWGLVPDGEPIVTHSSRLLPVLHGETPAMLKLAGVEDERRGYLPLEYWNGDGAARLLARTESGEAMLIERAMGRRSLSDMARNGADDEATAILCDAIAGLQKPRGPVPAGLIPLDTWFRELFPMAAKQGGLLARSAAAASELLSAQREIVPLHADLHHDNVLDFEERGWLAIDPKCVIGDRAFEYTILFCDPDLADPKPPVAIVPGRFERRLEIVLEKSGLERRRLLNWILAWCGLSASWFLGDDDPLAGINLAIAERAIRALDNL
ncbi:APH(6) family putative aminoglycoside O-phosphotransferase [Bosea caraganae]|uniref:APH(6) family putative aminoglycoside O-phosphotransferase n=1 Tax=Bosea caraganae TaxID=2763117 RepID=A0A370LD65_9HYPH|nr:APH(6) family putative aminoglycoside O-phosphotransferase [Bosea caraganae]RDJ29912.1 APH(6) family putative aminoglycoside O-phosphotransferase [Bosea caraganae]